MALWHPNTANRIVFVILKFISGVILFGGVAFVLGWLTGDERSSGPERTKSPATPKAIPEEFWRLALEEFDQGTKRTGLWARAYATAILGWQSRSVRFRAPRDCFAAVRLAKTPSSRV
jgi:hypothetical protein